MDAQTYCRLAADELAQAQAARKLHARTTVVLGYNNIPLRPTADGFDPGPILGDSSLCATNLERLILGGIKVIVWSPGIPYWNASWQALAGRTKVEFHMQQLEVVHDLARLTEGRLQVARDTEDMRRINESGGIAILLHLSGAAHLNDMGILREYCDLDVRMIHCAFHDPDEGTDERDLVQYDVEPHQRFHDTGRLNEHGVRTIEEMKKLGMIVDVAHLEEEGFDQVADLMEGLPFVYSHGACGALAPNERTFDDERIARIADSGGVYGIGVRMLPNDWDDPMSGDPSYVETMRLIAEGREQRQRELEAQSASVRDYIVKRYGEWDNWEVRELLRLGGYAIRNSLELVVAQMTHLRERFGPEIVGYGPDYETTFTYHDGLEEADKTPHLTQRLLEEGWPEAQVQGAMGHNFMRVFEQVLG